jgi:hypothetical protein
LGVKAEEKARMKERPGQQVVSFDIIKVHNFSNN